MSLILDALRRADAERERERGAVPGLHAQQVPGFPPAASRHEAARLWPRWAAIAGAGLLAAAAAWLIAGREAPPSVAARPAATATAAASAPSPEAAARQNAAAVTETVPPAPRADAPAPVAEPAPWPTQDGSRKAAAAEVAAAPAARAPLGQPAPPAGAAPVEAPITPREQLPENVRAQLPPLAVGGSIYSSNAPDRSVIIDGRILRENDRLTADLTLEQIRAKSAVLRFKGHRFEIRF